LVELRRNERPMILQQTAGGASAPARALDLLDAIWRNGRAYRSGVGAMTLQRGDALLIVGPRERLAALNGEADLIILNPVQARPVNASKAPLAAMRMVLTVGAVMLGYLALLFSVVLEG
jgi:hypothetical protein